MFVHGTENETVSHMFCPSAFLLCAQAHTHTPIYSVSPKPNSGFCCILFPFSSRLFPRNSNYTARTLRMRLNGT